MQKRFRRRIGTAAAGFLAVVMSVCGFTPTAPAGSEDDARPVIARGIEAMGGERAAARLRTLRARMRGEFRSGGLRAPATWTLSIDLPDKYRSETVMKRPDGSQSTLVQVISGDRGWVSADGRQLEIKDQTLRTAQESLYTIRVENLLPLLKERAFRLSAQGERKVHDRPAKVIRVECEGHDRIELFFDAETGLLVKKEQNVRGPLPGGLLQETYYRNYKEIDGVKRATKIEVFQEGRKIQDAEVLELTFVDQFGDHEFARP